MTKSFKFDMIVLKIKFGRWIYGEAAQLLLDGFELMRD